MKKYNIIKWEKFPQFHFWNILKKIKTDIVFVQLKIIVTILRISLRFVRFILKPTTRHYLTKRKKKGLSSCSINLINTKLCSQAIYRIERLFFFCYLLSINIKLQFVVRPDKTSRGSNVVLIRQNSLTREWIDIYEGKVNPSKEKLRPLKEKRRDITYGCMGSFVIFIVRSTDFWKFKEDSNWRKIFKKIY